MFSNVQNILFLSGTTQSTNTLGLKDTLGKLSILILTLAGNRSFLHCNKTVFNFEHNHIMIIII